MSNSYVVSCGSVWSLDTKLTSLLSAICDEKECFNGFLNTYPSLVVIKMYNPNIDSFETYLRNIYLASIWTIMVVILGWQKMSVWMEHKARPIIFLVIRIGQSCLFKYMKKLITHSKNKTLMFLLAQKYEVTWKSV